MLKRLIVFLVPFFILNCPGSGGMDMSGLLLLGGAGSGGGGSAPNLPSPRFVLKHNGNAMESGQTLNFGSEIANIQKSVTLTIENTGDEELTLSGTNSVELSGIDVVNFSVDAPSKNTLSPNESINFTVHFLPATDGTKNARLEIESNDSGMAKFSLNLTGIAEPAAPRLAITQGSTQINHNGTFNFGSVQEGTPGNLIIFNATNTGSLPLNFGSPRVDSNDDQFIIQEQPGEASLLPGASRTFGIYFNPNSVGSKPGIITFEDSNLPLVFSFNVTGTGTPTPVPTIEVTHNSVNYTNGGTLPTFGTVWPGDTSSTRTFTIRNTGTAEMTGLSISKGGTNQAQFNLSALSPAGTTLAPGESKTFGVSFSPESEGSKSAEIQVVSTNGDNGLGSSSTIQISGTGRSGRDILVSWTASKEKAVSATGGGYRVCFSQTNGFDPANAGNGSVFCENQNWTSGTTPNSRVITVSYHGTWYIQVIAFSQFNSGSTPSSQISIVVPQ
jgi:hypothetical protein